jgi:hypothetical protein
VRVARDVRVAIGGVRVARDVGVARRGVGAGSGMRGGVATEVCGVAVTGAQRDRRHQKQSREERARQKQ